MSPDFQTVAGETALTTACWWGELAVVKALLCREPAADLHFCTRRGATALSEAAKGYQDETVDFLLSLGADVNKGNDLGETPLISVMQQGGGLRGDAERQLVAMMEKLLNAGAKVSIHTSYGVSPLMLACFNDMPGAAAVLLRHGADIKERTFKATPLMAAIEASSVAVADILLAAGADINGESLGGQTALTRACCDGNVEMARYAIAAGANLNHQTQHFQNPLLLACHHNSADVAALLLEKGAEVKRENAMNMTPLVTACRVGATETVQVLLDHGVDKNAMARSGLTPLMEATQFGRVDVVEALLRAGADHRVVSPSLGTTALIQAVQMGLSTLVKLLVRYGASVTFEVTPADITAAAGLLIRHEDDEEAALLDAGDGEFAGTVGPKGAAAVGIKRGNAKDEELRGLLDFGSGTGDSAITAAITTSNVDLLRFLLNGNGVLEYLVDNRAALLQLASDIGDTSIVELIESGLLAWDREQAALAVHRINMAPVNDEFFALVLKKVADDRWGYGLGLGTEFVTPIYEQRLDDGDFEAVRRILEFVDAENEWQHKRELLMASGREEVLVARRDAAEIRQAALASLSWEKAKDDAERAAAKHRRMVSHAQRRGSFASDLSEGDDSGSASGSGSASAAAPPEANVPVPLTVNHETRSGYTALMRAAGKGELDLIKLLVDKGADVSHENRDGAHTALTWACSQNESEATALLLRCGADPNWETQNGSVALVEASYWGFHKCVKELVVAGGDVDHHTRFARMPLIEAIARDNWKVIRLLLQAGADVNAETAESMTPLMTAARTGSMRVLDLLMKFKVDTKHVCADGRNALHEARKYGRDAVVRLLIAANSLSKVEKAIRAWEHGYALRAFVQWAAATGMRARSAADEAEAEGGLWQQAKTIKIGRGDDSIGPHGVRRFSVIAAAGGAANAKRRDSSASVAVAEHAAQVSAARRSLQQAPSIAALVLPATRAAARVRQSPMLLQDEMERVADGFIAQYVRLLGDVSDRRLREEALRAGREADGGAGGPSVGEQNEDDEDLLAVSAAAREREEEEAKNRHRKRSMVRVPTMMVDGDANALAALVESGIDGHGGDDDADDSALASHLFVNASSLLAPDKPWSGSTGIPAFPQFLLDGLLERHGGNEEFVQRCLIATIQNAAYYAPQSPHVRLFCTLLGLPPSFSQEVRDTAPRAPPGAKGVAVPTTWHSASVPPAETPYNGVMAVTIAVALRYMALAGLMLEVDASIVPVELREQATGVSASAHKARAAAAEKARVNEAAARKLTGAAAAAAAAAARSARRTAAGEGAEGDQTELAMLQEAVKKSGVHYEDIADLFSYLFSAEAKEPPALVALSRAFKRSPAKSMQTKPPIDDKETRAAVKAYLRGNSRAPRRRGRRGSTFGRRKRRGSTTRRGSLSAASVAGGSAEGSDADDDGAAASGADATSPSTFNATRRGSATGRTAAPILGIAPDTPGGKQRKKRRGRRKSIQSTSPLMLVELLLLTGTVYAELEEYRFAADDDSDGMSDAGSVAGSIAGSIAGSVAGSIAGSIADDASVVSDGSVISVAHVGR